MTGSVASMLMSRVAAPKRSLPSRAVGEGRRGRGQRREVGGGLRGDQIEGGAGRAGGGVLAPGFLAPFGARTLAGCAAHGHAMLAHERGKQRPRLLAPVLALALERAVDLGGDG